MECLERQVEEEVILATAIVRIIHSISEAALAASKHGYFSDVHKMHEYAVYLLKRHTRIAVLREAIDTIRKAAETEMLEVVEI